MVTIKKPEPKIVSKPKDALDPSNFTDSVEFTEAKKK